MKIRTNWCVYSSLFLGISLSIYSRNVCPYVCLFVCLSFTSRLEGGLLRETGRVDRKEGGNGEGGFLCEGGHPFPQLRRVTQLVHS